MQNNIDIDEQIMQEIQEIVSYLMFNVPFTCHLLSVKFNVIDKDVYGVTNGEVIKVGRDRWLSASASVKVWIILHMYIHAVFMDVFTIADYSDKDKLYYFAAAEYAANSCIKDWIMAQDGSLKISFPKDAIYNPIFKNCTTNEIFNILKSNKNLDFNDENWSRDVDELALQGVLQATNCKDSRFVSYHSNKNQKNVSNIIYKIENDTFHNNQYMFYDILNSFDLMNSDFEDDDNSSGGDSSNNENENDNDNNDENGKDDEDSENKNDKKNKQGQNGDDSGEGENGNGKKPSLKDSLSNMLESQNMSKQQMRDNIQKNLMQQMANMSNFGDIPGNLSRTLTEIEAKKNDAWKLLSQYVKQTIKKRCGEERSFFAPKPWSWNYGLIYPGNITNKKPDVNIIVDTSGSITQDLIDLFAKTLSHILPHVNTCSVMTADVKVHEVVKIKSIYDIYKNQSIKFKGGGGTNFVPALEKSINGKFDVCLYLTDGIGNFGDHAFIKKVKASKLPIIWCLTTTLIKPPYGKVVNLDLK